MIWIITMIAQLPEMKGFDMIPDSLSSEVLLVVVAERVFGRIKSWMEGKENDKRMDKHGERIAKLEGRLNSR